MHPILFRLPGGLSIPTYSVCFLVAILVALVVYRRQLAFRGAPTDGSIARASVSIVIGLAGARGAHLIQSHMLKEPTVDWLAGVEQGGLVLFGGLLVGATVWSLLLWRRGRLGAVEADSAALAVIPAIAIGRLGCFANGCCWGTECRPGAGVGIVYPIGSRPDILMPDCSSWHPVQLYESALCMALAVVLALFSRKPAGWAFAVALVGLGAIRLLTELFRGDLGPAPRLSQGVAAALLAAGAGLILIARGRDKLLEKNRSSC